MITSLSIGYSKQTKKIDFRDWESSGVLMVINQDKVFLKIDLEPHIEYELRDHFTFEVEGAKFMPQYRNRNWNGEIHLFDMRTKKIYVGLLDKITYS